VKPNISEFSYGSALTEDIIKWAGTPLTAAPLFPSLIQEGQSGGGFDLNLNFRSGSPLFLQFKISNYMKSQKANEFRYFNQPYYRFHLRSLKYSEQHELLIELESKGNFVFYAAPIFHEISELNKAYLARQVTQQTIFIQPSEIGHLPDTKEHSIVFDNNRNAYFCSEPMSIKALGGNELAEHISGQASSKIPDIRSYTISDMLGRLSSQMIEIVQDILGNIEIPKRFETEQRVAYLARTFFGCEVFLARGK
jgi:hypothetical protein